MEIKDKTASGKIYIADSWRNLLGLDFIESLGLLYKPLNSDSNAVSTSPAQNAFTEQTNDTIERFPQFSQMTSDAALKLKPHQNSNHLLHLYSGQGSHAPGYMWTLLVRSMTVAFW